MMQFTECTLPSPPLPLPFSSTTLLDMNMNSNDNKNHRTRPWPVAGFPASKTLGSSFGDANCLEQLLVHCANAIETNDATLTQQILWVLNNIAPPDGDSNQRLTCGFLRALISRAAKTGNCKLLLSNSNDIDNVSNGNATHKFSVIELASFVDLTPWHRFGFTAANAAILEAVEGYSTIHIVDLSLTRCMQIPTLIDAIASRRPRHPQHDGGPYDDHPSLIIKLTVAGVTEGIPPLMLDESYEELGSKLVNFARSRNVALEFRVIPSSSSDGFASLIDLIRRRRHRTDEEEEEEVEEALVINCHMMLHYITEEETLLPNGVVSLRTMFLKAIRSLEPKVVLLIDEDADFTSNNLVNRLRSAYNYLWIPYDTVDTFLPKGSRQREWYEADICWKIENVVAHEGIQRIERLEPKNRWVQRMRSAGFNGISFSEDAFSEVKSMLDEHSAGWGVKREEEDLVLTWKGHNVVFATAWVPT